MGRFHSFVVFAEMRTGSNFLEANLNAIPGVACLGEAFNPYFIGGENKQELLGVDMAARAANPRNLLLAMRQQTKGLSGFRYFHDHDPRVFDMVVDDPDCAKVILTRNQLESYISWKIAMESDQWWLANTKHLKTVRPVFDLDEFKGRIDALQQFQLRLLGRLQETGQTAFYIDYDDVLNLKVLNGLAAFLDVPGRLEALDYRFKKQNPEPLIAKVANPDEMMAGLARLDWFNLNHTPHFEPRRPAAVPQYVASVEAPLLFMPVKCSADQQMRKWLQAFGAIENGFDRQTLRAWRESHPGQRSFTVLRHPLARAHAAFSDFVAKEWMPELRPYLKRVHKYQLPPKGMGYATAAEYREGLMVWLELVKHILAGRTELKLPLHMATQRAILQGFGSVQPPDLVLREDRLETGLAHLCAEVGAVCPPLPPSPEKLAFDLANIYGPDLEAGARAAYARDYSGFGFSNWAPVS